MTDDPDTKRLLDIVLWNLTRFFAYDREEAAEMIRIDHARRGDDFYHHEGAFRSAAMIHYLQSHETLDAFHPWFAAQEFDEASREADEYYRDHYFVR